jgi:hypothetical protein
MTYSSQETAALVDGYLTPFFFKCFENHGYISEPFNFIFFQTMVVNLENHPDNLQGFGTISNTHATLVLSIY